MPRPTTRSPEEAEPAADPVDVCVHRDLGPVEREDHHAGRRLSADAGQRRQIGDRLVARAHRRASRGRSGRRARAEPPGCAAPSSGARPPRRIDSSNSAVGASRTSGHDVEARPEAGVGDVAVRVRRVLREDRQDELVHRVFVRLVDRLPVHLAQAIADRDHAPLRWSLPLCLGCVGHAPNLRRVRERVIDVDGDPDLGSREPGRGHAGRLLARQPDERRRLASVHEAPRTAGLRRGHARVRRARRHPTQAGSTAPFTPTGAGPERCSTELGLERYSLVIHDWGAIGLIPALADPSGSRAWSPSTPIPFGARLSVAPAGPLGLAPASSRRDRQRALARADGGPRASAPHRPRLRGDAALLRRAGAEELLAQGDPRRDPRPLSLCGPGGALRARRTTSDRLTAPALLLWAQRDRYIGR